MAETILVTGGAGFIGRHVTAALLARGYHVRVIDSLIDQVHGRRTGPGLAAEVEFFHGDIRNRDLLSRAARGADRVIHLAAEVGVGQSMYAIERYVSANDIGTAILFEILAEQPVQRVVVASSMSIYGEGLYRTRAGQVVEHAIRTTRRGWDPLTEDGQELIPAPTPEWKRPSLASVYALTKYTQECLTLTLTAAYGMEGVALRLFNVYGPGQALSNPYTGVLAIFASRLLNGQRPLVFEDGRQRRDFVSVHDVARAFVVAMEHPQAAGGVFNIGSGRHVTVMEVATALAQAMDRDELTPDITGKARAGDIRHCFADISLAKQRLAFTPEHSFEDSLPELVEWVSRQQAIDRVMDARQELEARGLVA
jgi:dTDP-L-rhamnose 4-epimerase